jgi:hemolysin III
MIEGSLFNMRQPEKLFKIPVPLPFQTPGEEAANAILHGLGVLLAVTGLILLTLKAHGYMGEQSALVDSVGSTLVIASYAIFTITMIIMFLASTLYHAIQHEGTKQVFRILDHSAIYLLIAGTYTPFSLLGFRGSLGWVYFGVEWGLAALGIIFYSVNFKFIKKIEVIVYILMGWAVFMGFSRLFKSIPLNSIIFLIAGGIAYTLGTFWYSRKTVRGAHVVWHVFVLAGAVCHWWSIWFMS